MPTPSERDDPRTSDPNAAGAQPALDAAAGDPRTGEDPAARLGASDDADDTHPAPVRQPSADNTDRRA